MAEDDEVGRLLEDVAAQVEPVPAWRWTPEDWTAGFERLTLDRRTY